MPDPVDREIRLALWKLHIHYRITAAGRRILDQLRTDVDELHRELVLGIEPTHESVARGATAKAAGEGRGARSEALCDPL